MARKRKPSASKLAYQKEYKRIKQIFYRAQKAGKPLDPELMPKKPSELSSKQYASAVKKLKKITPSELREKSAGYTPHPIKTPEYDYESQYDYEPSIPPMDNQASLQALEEIGRYIDYLRPDPSTNKWQRYQQEIRIPKIQLAWEDLMTGSSDLTSIVYGLEGKTEAIIEAINQAVYDSSQEEANVAFNRFLNLIFGSTLDSVTLAYYSDYGA